MRSSLWFSFIVLLSIGVILYKLFSQEAIPKTEITKPDQCMQCHQKTNDMDASHPIAVFGCAKCHGGNAFATDKTVAHQGMVLNPSRLEHAEHFCGECHAEVIHRVKNSMMESLQGIQDVLAYQWGEKSTYHGEHNLTALADDHFRKACAACHVNQKEEVFDDIKYARGGGCADCHRVKKEKGKHPEFSTRIPSENCLKCHNRSNRIGLSYFGQFESEGYGTPYKNGDFTNRVDHGRFYYELPADVHHTKAGLDCIDCHTEKGIMGDGQKHAHMEDAEDIKCKDCHTPSFKEMASDTLAHTLINTNALLPIPKEIAYSRKNAPIYNLQKNDHNITFYRKRDGQIFDLTKMSDKPYHTLAMHQRLDCSACHATWTPSCYGCHDVYFENSTQFDWIKHKMTKGEWMELRSFLRFEAPSLGIGYNEKVMPFAPGCQVIGTIFSDKKVEQFHAMAMAGWDPHTTQKETRTCAECHFDSAALGLGRGILDMKEGNITFQPFFNSKKSGLPVAYPIDAFTSLEGKQFQSTSREKARSFNKQELTKVIEAWQCIICHRTYEDKIYQDFNASKMKFYRGETTCLK